MSDVELGLAIVGGTITIFLALEMRIKNLIKHYLAELKPNGGSSMKDQINRVETRLDDLYKHLLEK
jgi:hypothetical protein